LYLVSYSEFEDEYDEEDDETNDGYNAETRTAMNRAITIFCDSEFRLTIPINKSIDLVDAPLENLGKFSLYDLLVIRIDESGHALDSLSVPILCIDREKPSNLSIDLYDGMVLLQFSCSTIDLVNTAKSVKFDVPQSAEHSNKDINYNDNFKEGSKESFHPIIDHHHYLYEESKNIPFVTETTVKFWFQPNLKWKLSDLTSLLTNLIHWIDTSPILVMKSIRIIKIYTMYMVEAMRFGFIVFRDLSLDSFTLVNTTISNILVRLDEHLESLETTLLELWKILYEYIRENHPMIDRVNMTILNQLLSLSVHARKMTMFILKPFLSTSLHVATPIFRTVDPLISPYVQSVTDYADQSLQKYKFVHGLSVKLVNVTRKSIATLSEQSNKNDKDDK
jgi:hypothetical protein